MVLIYLLSEKILQKNGFKQLLAQEKDHRNFCTVQEIDLALVESTRNLKKDRQIESQIDSQRDRQIMLGTFPSDNFSKVKLGPFRRHRLQWGAERYRKDGLGAKHLCQNRLWAERCSQDRLEMLPFGKLPFWEVAIWENTLGKLSLWENPCGKYLTSFE